MKVLTTIGLVDIDLLDVKDIIFLEDNARVIATEWKLKETGDLIKRDVHVVILRGLDVASEQMNP